MLEPIKIKLFFLTTLLIVFFVSFVQVLILPFVKVPEDFPCPEYSKLKKPNLFFFANFKRVNGFFPSISDMKPGKKTK